MSTVFCDNFRLSGKAIPEVIFLKPLETVFVFITGALGYWALELMWRGYTHWTMPIAGGICFIIIYAISNFMSDPLWKKWIMCASCITAVEFVVGSIVNLRLGWAVWDYSGLSVNLMGQISLRFYLLWLVLAIPTVFLSNILRYFLFIPLYRRGRHSS